METWHNTSRIGAILLVLLVSMLGSCTPKRYLLDYSALDPPPPDQVIAAWEARREILVRVLRDKEFTLREFGDSVEFFAEVTGLAGDQDWTRYGWVPNDRLAGDLERWDVWFRERAHALDELPGPAGGG